LFGVRSLGDREQGLTFYNYSWFQEYEAQKGKMIVVGLGYRKDRSNSLGLGHLAVNSSFSDCKNFARSNNNSQST
jgi:hypothetical protein